MRGLLISALLLVSGAAGAGEHPCKADVDKFCAGIPKGGGRIAQCLKDHESELSEACKAKAEFAKQKRGDVEKACAADLQKYCPSVKPGGGRILVCLRDHKQDLSMDCQSALAEKPAK